jgi:hypothetical protein
MRVLFTIEPPPGDCADTLEHLIDWGDSAGYVLEVDDGVSGVGLSLNLSSPAGGQITISDVGAEPDSLGRRPLRAVDIDLSDDMDSKLTGATVSIPLTEAPAGSAGAAVYYYNDSLGRWEEVAGSTYDPATKTASARVTHFSTYGVFEKSVGIARSSMTRSRASVAVRVTGSRLTLHVPSRVNVTVDLLDLRGRIVSRLEPGMLEAQVKSSDTLRNDAQVVIQVQRTQPSFSVLQWETLSGVWFTEWEWVIQDTDVIEGGDRVVLTFYLKPGKPLGTTIWADDFSILDLTTGVRYGVNLGPGRVVRQAQKPAATYALDGRVVPAEFLAGRSGCDLLGPRTYVIETSAGDHVLRAPGSLVNAIDR